ncbi:MAG: hypothetical protein WCJ45_08675 [bacterium]
MEKNEIDKLQAEKKHLEEKIHDQEKQMKKIMETLSDLEKNIETQATFACEKIEQPCPFIKIINKKTFEQLDQQKKTFVDQQEQITKTILTLQTKLKELNLTQAKQESNTIKELEKLQKEGEKSIEIIKTFLNEIAYKDIETIYGEYSKLDKEAKTLDKDINGLEQESKQVEEWKQQTQKRITQKESIDKQLNEYTTSIAAKEQERKTLAQEKEKIDTASTGYLEKNNLAMRQYHRDIDMLINEFKEHQLERKRLEEQETILGDLYTIFSKELLLLVLQDHLPILNDIINSYLAQIVDYQISLQLTNDTEKVELEARIIDEKGMRDTKSLS